MPEKGPCLTNLSPGLIAALVLLVFFFRDVAIFEATDEFDVEPE